MITSDTPLGVGIDLGTSHIRLGLWDAVSDVLLASSSSPNPQEKFGSDILSRLYLAAASGEVARCMSEVVSARVKKMTEELCSRSSLRTDKIGAVVIVGNTAMLSIFTGKNFGLLLKPSSWIRELDCRPEDVSPWRREWGVAPDASIEIIMPASGFVGSDVLSGVVTTGLTDGPAGALLVDFGVNTEIALWDGSTLWSTSAAGGPAFETCAPGLGVEVREATVYSVGFDERSNVPKPGLSGLRARGVCGPALVDAAAFLLGSGTLSGSGRFRPGSGSEEAAVSLSDMEITVRKRDVDMLQRAKAGIAAAMICLLQKAGLGLGDLRRICVAGVFGKHLDVANAQAIGLLPETPEAAVELCGDAALMGCGRLLINGEGKLSKIRSVNRTVNMSFHPGFEKTFIDNLFLRPMKID